MQRREFLEGCAAASLRRGGRRRGRNRRRARTPGRGSWTCHGRLRIRLTALEPEVNYVFQYPFEATPCLLVKLRAPVAVQPALKRADGTAYTWNGGVGRDRNAVAFSAICAHKLAYPTREVFVHPLPARCIRDVGRARHPLLRRSQRLRSPRRARAWSPGPAPQPLAAILLEHDPGDDGVFALGTVGPEQFDAFFDKYRMKLALEYGESRARRNVGDTTIVREMSTYCRNTIQC